FSSRRRHTGFSRDWSSDVCSSDLLGEAVISEREAEQHFDAYRDLIRGVAPTVNAWPHDPQIDEDDRGPLPRMNLSIKLSALDPRSEERRVGKECRWRTPQEE